MARFTPTDWKTQIKIFEAYACKYKRKKGSHHVLTYPGAKRAVVIPNFDEIDLDIIKNNMRTVGMDADPVHEFLWEDVTILPTSPRPHKRGRRAKRNCPTG